MIGKKSGERHEFTHDDLAYIEENFESIISEILNEVFDVKN